MITNRRQLAQSQKQLRLAEASAEACEAPEAQVYLDMAERFRAEIEEYMSINSGETYAFDIQEIDDLAEALVKARLARKWTQAQLAEHLGVSEQMVQRDESGAYERASLARLADIADALGYQLRGKLEPADEQVATSDVRLAILPTEVLTAEPFSIYVHDLTSSGFTHHERTALTHWKASLLSAGRHMNTVFVMETSSSYLDARLDEVQRQEEAPV